MRSAALVLAAMAGPAWAAGLALDVSIVDVQSDKGQIRAGIYTDAKSFRKEAQALAVVSAPAAAGEVRLRFEGLAPGRYAVMAYHDEDGNGELNRRFGMFPTEGYALSNNPKVAGPPAFDDSVFELPVAGGRLNLEMRY